MEDVYKRQEQDWVTQHGDIRIGFLTSDAGISTYVPESGQLVGVINDYITFASDSISNQKLDFSLVGYDSMEEEIQALKDGQIDLIFHFAQNPYVAEENNFVLSNTVLTLNMAAVTAQNYFNENHANTVALLKDCLLYTSGPTASSRASSRRRAARSTASFPPRRLPGWNTACLPLPRPAAPTSTLPSAGPGRT